MYSKKAILSRNQPCTLNFCNFPVNVKSKPLRDNLRRQSQTSRTSFLVKCPGVAGGGGGVGWGGVGRMIMLGID